jgi:hypothetical protein
MTFSEVLKKTMKHISQDNWLIEPLLRWEWHSVRKCQIMYKILVGNIKERGHLDM